MTSVLANPQTDELQLLEDLLNQVLRQVEEVVQSGETLSDELQGGLAEVITQATQRINEIQTLPSNVPPPPTVPPQIGSSELPPIGTELLWILAGGQEDAFVNYLRTFPDPTYNSILRNPEQLRNIIAHLQETMPQGRNEVRDGIQQAPLQSSNIYGFQFDPSTGKLLVRFQEGNIYEYDGVPQGVYKVFQQGAVPAKTKGMNKYGAWYEGKMPSLGAAFYELIRKGGYPYRKIQ